MRQTSILAGVLLVIITSCLDDPECFQLNNNMVGITFKNMGDAKQREMTFVSVTAEGTDKELAAEITGSVFVLPLNYFANETTYNFQTSDTTYQLKLDYSTQTQFVSTECGERFVLSSLDVVEHGFDSVRLVNANPGANVNARNIELFLE